MHLVDFYNFKPPADLIVVRDESQAMRVQAAKTSLVRRARVAQHAPRRAPRLEPPAANRPPPPPPPARAPRCAQEFRRNAFNTDSVDEALDTLDFCYKIVSRSGLSDNGTYLPKAIHPKYNCIAPKTSIDDAMEEARMVICGAIDGLLKKQGLAAKDIDVLITTCSVFCPTPSLASLVVNHFGMRPDVQSYHLGGMGCSNGVVAVNLVNDILGSRRNVNAILLTTEITTPAFYKGTDKHRQVTNMLFRTGANAALFSNRRRMAARAKYALTRNVRVHLAARDPAYKCIWWGPDAEGNNGIYLGKDVVNEASRGLSMAMFKVAPSILSVGQIAAYAATEASRRLLGSKAPPYKPRFAECVDHFLIHAGGAKVLDGIGKELQLDDAALEPSRAVLHDYGNISSSTTWYTLGFVESVRGVRRGERLLQIGVGSGIKCGVNVWTALRDIHDVQDAWAHRATDPSVLRARRGRASAVAALLRVLLFAVVAALALHWALGAGLLAEYEPTLAPLVAPVAKALAPVGEALAPLAAPVAAALEPVAERVRGLLQG
ncbi:CUT1 [Scenedesmus sp. PABB004]|nr:CUT1 [Scenedesmus sp. PABB004]